MTCWEGSAALQRLLPRLGNIECRSKIVISTYAKILSPPFLNVQSLPLQGALELSMFDARQKGASDKAVYWVLLLAQHTPHKNGVPPGPGGAELISNLVTSRLRGLALNQKPRRAESHCGSHQASAFIEPGDEL
ncbi:uncharacterized protein G6M90_00g010080 [Metarhizium brunneum]|uniref:Uncharacterized protein n=1 Tax=Metarhizium brunneum TaxID=500148 RepID=A0A7D5YNI9_9HYPO|nr:hypothetical protein G6M90_00g010080 [Metarhizium brunneum]